jgi:pyruvate kinase
MSTISAPSSFSKPRKAGQLRPRQKMRRHRNAKIIATLGPASSSPDIVRGLFDAGADVFRLNFSHGTHEDHKKRYDIIRSIEKDVGRPIGVLVDLQGPKLRVGTFTAGRIILIFRKQLNLTFLGLRPSA